QSEPDVPFEIRPGGRGAERAQDAHEVSTVDIAVRVDERGSIRHVSYFDTQFEATLFSQREGAEQTHIEVHSARATELIAARVSESDPLRLRPRGRVVVRPGGADEPEFSRSRREVVRLHVPRYNYY